MSAKYSRLLRSLLPRGVAWNAGDGSVLGALIDALALELARVDARCEDLLRERDPRTTTELLPDWERLVGLPSECAPLSSDTDSRRFDVLTQLNLLGGQTPAYFTKIAELTGFDIEIIEWKDVWGIGGTGGPSPIGATDYHTWIVKISDFTFRYFEVGVSSCGDPLRYWSQDQLECAIEKVKPLHTEVLFVYEE